MKKTSLLLKILNTDMAINEDNKEFRKFGTACKDIEHAIGKAIRIEYKGKYASKVSISKKDPFFLFVEISNRFENYKPKDIKVVNIQTNSGDGNFKYYLLQEEGIDLEAFITQTIKDLNVAKIFTEGLDKTRQIADLRRDRIEMIFLATQLLWRSLAHKNVRLIVYKGSLKIHVGSNLLTVDSHGNINTKSPYWIDNSEEFERVRKIVRKALFL